MSKDTYLFIGGPSDGQRREVQDERNVTKVFTVTPNYDPVDEIAIGLPAVETLYERRSFVHDEDLVVYTTMGMSSKEIMQRLIENYRPLVVECMLP